MMEALWVQQWFNRVDDKLLRRMLRSSEPWARAASTRVLCYWRDRIAESARAAQGPGERRAPGGSARSRPRGELLPERRSGGGGTRDGRSSAGSLPGIYARPDDEDVEAVHPLMPALHTSALLSLLLGALPRPGAVVTSCALRASANAAGAGATAEDSATTSRRKPSPTRSAGSRTTSSRGSSGSRAIRSTGRSTARCSPARASHGRCATKPSRR